MRGLSFYIPYIRQTKLTNKAIEFLVNNISSKEKSIFLIDNSEENNYIDKYFLEKFFPIQTIIKGENIGLYRTYFDKNLDRDSNLLAFFHNDLFVYEKDFDNRIKEVFEENPRLGLLGFIGSDEIDFLGGRGLGTMSNFQGKKVSLWQGSPAEVHGKRINNFRAAVVLDSCAMIFRKEALDQLEFRQDLPLHHFHDRVVSVQIRELGWDIGVLGIECDHISGQTANQEKIYFESSRDWWIEKDIKSFKEWSDKNKNWIDYNNNPSRGKKPENWDQMNYLEAERLFLTEYRDKKHLIPFKIK